MCSTEQEDKGLGGSIGERIRRLHHNADAPIQRFDRQERILEPMP